VYMQYSAGHIIVISLFVTVTLVLESTSNDVTNAKTWFWVQGSSDGI